MEMKAMEISHMSQWSGVTKAQVKSVLSELPALETAASRPMERMITLAETSVLEQGRI